MLKKRPSNRRSSCASTPHSRPPRFCTAAAERVEQGRRDRLRHEQQIAELGSLAGAKEAHGLVLKRIHFNGQIRQAENIRPENLLRNFPRLETVQAQQPMAGGQIFHAGRRGAMGLHHAVNFRVRHNAFAKQNELLVIVGHVAVRRPTSRRRSARNVCRTRPKRIFGTLPASSPSRKSSPGSAGMRYMRVKEKSVNAAASRTARHSAGWSANSRHDFHAVTFAPDRALRR